MDGSRRFRFALCRRVGRRTYHVTSRRYLDEVTVAEARQMARAPWMDCRTVWIVDREQGRVARVVEVPAPPFEVMP